MKNKFKDLKSIIEKQIEDLDKNKERIRKEREQACLDNKSCLSYWFPIVSKIDGIKTPKTNLYFLHFEDQLSFLDGKKTDNFNKVMEEIKTGAKQMGGKQWFLKNSLFSGKHNWQYTCALKDLNQLEHHVGALTDFAYGVGCEESLYLVLREWIDTNYDFTAFGGMPVTKERRYFVEEGRVTFHHPYWPPFAIKEASVEDFSPLLENINKENPEEIKYLTHLTEKVGKALKGSWSVDWLQDKAGNWYLIDMAEKHKSFIWKEYKLKP